MEIDRAQETTCTDNQTNGRCGIEFRAAIRNDFPLSVAFEGFPATNQQNLTTPYIPPTEQLKTRIVWIPNSLNST